MINHTQNDDATTLLNRSQGHKNISLMTQDQSEKHSKFDLEYFSVEALKNHTAVALHALENYLSKDDIRGLDLMHPELLQNLALTIMEQAKTTPADQFPVILERIFDLYIQTGIQVHSTGYMGRQFSGVIPLAGVVDFVSSIINQPASFYEAAQLPNVVEQIMANELNQFIGWEEGSFAMVTTSGGSMANLTAILAARNSRFPDFWNQGSAGQGLRPAIAVGADVHYSISRAAGITGIGEEQIIKLPLNEKYQIDIAQAQARLDQAKAQGLTVFCMVGCAGTTSTGAFDDLEQLGQICQKENIWLHIDACHGGSWLVSDQERHKLRGIHLADSFAWDAHKTLFVPAMCTLLFYKDKQKSYGAFRQEASYVFEQTPDAYTALDSAEQNFECTKRPMIMNLWVAWTCYGKELFATKLNYLNQMARLSYCYLESQPDFETIHDPQCNILCFRYKPDDLTPHVDIQTQIRNELKADGKFFISKVSIDNQTALRVVFMNHNITLEHVMLLIEEIRRAGKKYIEPNRSSWLSGAKKEHLCK